MILRDIDQLLGKVELTIFAIQTEWDFFEAMDDQRRQEALERLKAINLLMQEILVLDITNAQAQVA